MRYKRKKRTEKQGKRGEYVCEIKGKKQQFDTNKFYQYVFADIEAEMEIEILDTTNDQDKAAKRVYNIISEITSEVMKKMNEKCFTELT